MGPSQIRCVSKQPRALTSTRQSAQTVALEPMRGRCRLRSRLLMARPSATGNGSVALWFLAIAQKGCHVIQLS